MRQFIQGRPLSPRQSEVFEFMRAFFEGNDQLPPVALMARRFDVNPNAIFDTLRAIERKGWIEHNEVGKYRFKRVTIPALRDFPWPPNCSQPALTVPA